MLLGEIIGVVIPAAGTGSRMGGDRPKQFMDLGGVPVLLRTVLAFQRSAVVDVIVIAARSSEIPAVRAMLRMSPCPKVVSVVRGGRHRQDSVLNGLRELGKHGAGIVLIHDAVRPFVTEKMIMDVSMAVIRYGGALLAVHPKDTLKVSTGGDRVGKTLPREGLWLAQTPQAFRMNIIMEASLRAKAHGYLATDDAALVEACGVDVRILEGSYENIKITTLEDMDLARVIAGRTGTPRGRRMNSRARVRSRRRRAAPGRPRHPRK